MNECSCGSGLPSEQVFDARGIYVTSVCEVCRDSRLAGYRQDIFEDPKYWTDEPVEPEE